MTILDLIKKSALMLNISQILEEDGIKDMDYWTDQEEILNNNFELKRMFEFAKMVIDEVNVYSPKVRQLTLNTIACKLDIASISDFAKIISVNGKDGPVKYTIAGRYIKVEKEGEYTITYTQYPSLSDMLAEIDRQEGAISEELLVSGVNSYYCLASGLLPEFNAYNALYVEQLSRLKNLKLFAMPCRSWHG